MHANAPDLSGRSLIPTFQKSNWRGPPQLSEQIFLLDVARLCWTSELLVSGGCGLVALFCLQRCEELLNLLTKAARILWMSPDLTLYAKAVPKAGTNSMHILKTVLQFVLECERHQFESYALQRSHIIIGSRRLVLTSNPPLPILSSWTVFFSDLFSRAQFHIAGCPPLVYLFVVVHQFLKRSESLHAFSELLYWTLLYHLCQLVSCCSTHELFVLAFVAYNNNKAMNQM